MSHYTPLFDSICTSARMADLPDDTCRMFYVWLLAKCDAWGRCDARPRKLNVSVWPLLGKSDAETARCLEALRQAGLVDVYWPSGSDPFLQVPDWEEKAGTAGRRSHRRPSAFPDPSVVVDCKLPGEPGISGHRRAKRAEPGIDLSRDGDGDRVEDRGVEGGTAAGKPPKPDSQTWETVLASDEFATLRAWQPWMDAWAEWIAHASERGTKAKVPTPTRAKAIFRKALKAGPAVHAIAIQASIANDWQGIEPDWLKPDSAEVKAAQNAEAEATRRRSEAKAKAEKVRSLLPLMEARTPEGLDLIESFRVGGRSQSDAEVVASLKQQIEKARAL